MRSACSNCDADTGLTPQGLCRRCRDELRFVVRPVAHREAYRRRLAAEAGLRADLERLGIGDTGLTPQGLCRRCRDELRFVVRPVAHREAYRRRLAAEAGLRADLERLGIVMINSLPQDNSLWICDLCNARIPITAEHTLIPMLGSYALCIPCATTLPYWPDGWTQPTPRACRCGPCQTPLLNALART